MSNHYNPSRPYHKSKRHREREDEGRAASRPTRRNDDMSIEQRLENVLRREAEVSAQCDEAAEKIRHLKGCLSTFGIRDFGPNMASINLVAVRDDCDREWARQAQVQRDAEAARVAEAQAAEAAKAVETERLRLEEQAGGMDVDLEVGSANPKGQQNLVATEEDTLMANEDGHVPESAAGAEQLGEASTALASSELMKDTPVSGPVQPEQLTEARDANAQVKDSPLSGSTASGQKDLQAKVALPLAGPLQAEGKPQASDQVANNPPPALSQRPVLPAAGRKKDKDHCCVA